MPESQARLFIDTEIYLFRSASAAEVEVEWQEDVWQYFCDHRRAKAFFQDEIAKLMEFAPNLRPVLALSAPVSFRYGVWPTYKANRKKHRKPCGYAQLCDWIRDVASARGWGVVELPDVEADDVLGILAGPNDVIASTDKDLLTIPGTHLRSGTFEVVTRPEADRAFYAQVLSGDASDNYPGCPKVGEVGARRALQGLQGEAEMWGAVLADYQKAGLSPHYAITQARCARILRPGEYDMEAQRVRLWNPPVG